MLRVCIVTLTLLMITLCEGLTFAYTVSVTASPLESAVEIDKTTDVFKVCGSFSEDATQRQESETTKCRWKYIDATAYSDEACTTIDTTVVSVITESDTEWSADEIYTKNVIVKGLTVGINWIKFKMKYQINETGEGTELISNPVKIFVYKIEFIDEIPDYSLDPNKDSDNFFLRQHDKTTGTADYKDLDIYYYILPEELPINNVKIKIRAEEEEDKDTYIEKIDGEKTDGNYKTGDELNVKWPDVRDTAGNFQDNRFYTVQLEVDINGVAETFKTPLGDADTTMIGYQCKDKCLVIHDLVFKHRPFVRTGSGETVAPDGPVYPFSAAIIGNYKLWKHGTLLNTVAWSAPPTNYSSGGFPTAPALPGRQAFTYHYPVLKASIDNDTAGASKHYIDIDNNNRSCAGGEATLMHRGHVEKGQPHGDYCFIQFWMYETASHLPYSIIPGYNNVFWHEGDWEMVQLCIKLTGTKKIGWFLPHAATASQHYYGQTLAWRIDQSSIGGLFQSFVETGDNGNRVNIYIAENSHATYFRTGEIKTNTEKCGTQIQYELAFATNYMDKIIGLGMVKDYKLVPLNHKGKKGIGDWPGQWGDNGALDGGPRSPFLREAEITTGFLNLNSNPVDFHNLCRKLIGGTPQPETEL
jgi:hypothetical protein